MNKRVGNGLIAGGIVGSFLFVIAGIFIYSNRLREVTTQAFTVLGSNEVRTIMVGIENWRELLILCDMLLAACLFLISVGFKIKGRK